MTPSLIIIGHVVFLIPRGDMEPLVTIYILNYNYGKYLEQSIQSVLAQSYKNLEFIIIDDGSTDDSISILDKYANSDINIIKQKNIGLVKSIYKAFSISNGKYVVRVDADDWIKSDFLECLVNEIEKNTKVAMIFPDYYEVNEQGMIIHRIRRHDFSTNVSMFDQPAHGACTLMRRETYFKVGGHNLDLECQDGVDIWLSIIDRYKVLNFKKPLFYYRRHDKSITHDSQKIINNRMSIYRDHALKRGFIKEPIIAFIPIRSHVSDNKEFVLNYVGEKTLLDITIDKAIMSSEISQIVISTNSSIVSNYVRKKYAGIKKELEIHLRNNALVQNGVEIVLSIKDYFLKKEKFNVSAMIVLIPHYPFSSYQYIDSAIFSSFLFGTDVVDTVIQDSSIMYFHDGSGMKKLHEGYTRNERDFVYISKGGITFYSKKAIKQIIETKIDYKGIGHILITQKASFEVTDKVSLRMANFISKEVNL